jgi:23S rRNA (uracil1939-C5)-methyltransferase
LATDIIKNDSGHVETVVCLNNNNPKLKGYVDIGVDAEEYYRIKGVKKN